MSPKYSIVIPVYNRPDELDELLSSLTFQTFQDFEVIVVEDGSSISSEHIIEKYAAELTIYYYKKENGGQGFARNHGYERANGEYFIVFDSDCIIPTHYLEVVNNYLLENRADAFGGPDAAHPSFSLLQKAISYTMTSVFTTGGIRGRKQHIGTFHPRSFNMGISREVYDKTKGYIIPFMGEDMEFSTRIVRSGFRSVLIPSAFVYHKRRTSIMQFYKQLKYFGRARINISRFHSNQIRVIHLFPLFFTLGWIVSICLSLLDLSLGYFGLACYAVYLLFIFFGCLFTYSALGAAILAPFITLIQMLGYAYGLVYEWFRKLRGINPNTKYIDIY
ncbi:MAG: glycosyltransferase [Cyclobacteriaceae bacterium]